MNRYIKSMLIVMVLFLLTACQNMSITLKTRENVPEASSQLPEDSRPPEARTPDISPEIDPMLQYQAALSLYQSVKWLNRATRDATPLKKRYIMRQTNWEPEN